MRARLLLGLSLVLTLGCAKPFAPVSGKVTLNGKPLAGAMVNFQPVARPGNPNPGAGSAGKTNENGEYSLKAATGQDGAVIGPHRVMISLLSEQVGDSDQRPPRGGWPLKDKVPDRYNKNSTLTFDVKSGSNQADFSLTSP